MGWFLLASFLPSCLCSGLGNLAALFLGHCLETPFAADLTAFAPDCSHVFGEIGRSHDRGFGLRLWGSLLARGLVNNPLGKLIRVSWTFASADSHAMIMAQ